MGKKNRKTIGKERYSELMTAVGQVLQQMKTPPSLKQLVKKLGIKDQRTKHAVKEILRKKTSNADERGKKFKGSNEFIIGKVDFVNPRFAYIISDEVENDVMVKAENLLHAFDDDTVKVMVFPAKGKKDRREGKVLEIVERHRDEFVGRLQKSGRYAFVVPDFRKMHDDIFIPPELINEAETDDKVLVKITQWPMQDRNAEGKVIRVLGKAGENDAEIHSIMAEFGLPFKFPDNVQRAASAIRGAIDKKEIEKRKDFRHITTMTIDPADAKDFDDALSFRRLENGHIEVGVHIADVTYYLKNGTILDKEAFERGTSVYLVDRTIPMLPERLSNDLCSLRPNEDKLTFSAVFELDESAKVMSEWFGRTIIHSDKRFTYEEAQEGIESGQGEWAEELAVMNKLALKLRDYRFSNGAVNFETAEVKFELDEKGKPLRVIPKVRKDAHKMIEEFMLLANKRVAEYVYKRIKGKDKDTFVYRTHDYPDPEKVNAFSLFAKKFGHDLKINEKAVSRSLNHLLDEIEGKPEQNVLQSLAIRSMAKAKYTTEAAGHFGLAFAHYTHFTSPIRRYPDVMVHRLLQHYLLGGASVDAEQFELDCRHASEMEKRAADAERASIKYKQVEFMATMINQEFDGIVSGVTEWGIFVEMIETKCEGMVRMADLDDDYYEYDADNYCLRGQRNVSTITLGDQVRVKVMKADINRRTIDLKLVEREAKNPVA